jgi:uncharacterized protein with NRDE domain
MRESGPILAPLDIEAGGTWLGLNGRGVFVGLTNLRPDGPESAGPIGRPGARSRGEVVMAALDARSATEAATMIEDLEAEAYNPFQLFVADAEQAWLTVYRDGSRTRALEPGVHVIGNVEDERVGAVLGSVSATTSVSSVRSMVDSRSPDVIAVGDTEHPRARKLARIRERVEKLLTVRSRDLLEDLGEVCREHVDTNPFESTCVHVAERYGTRSSLLLELGEEADASRLWATDGPPCERSFENLSDLLGQLDTMSRSFSRG